MIDRSKAFDYNYVHVQFLSNIYLVGVYMKLFLPELFHQVTLLNYSATAHSRLEKLHWMTPGNTTFL